MIVYRQFALMDSFPCVEMNGIGLVFGRQDAAAVLDAPWQHFSFSSEQGGLLKIKTHQMKRKKP